VNRQAGEDKIKGVIGKGQLAHVICVKLDAVSDPFQFGIRSVVERVLPD
jgi:hypothetical protein